MDESVQRKALAQFFPSSYLAVDEISNLWQDHIAGPEVLGSKNIGILRLNLETLRCKPIGGNLPKRCLKGLVAPIRPAVGSFSGANACQRRSKELELGALPFAPFQTSGLVQAVSHKFADG